MSSELNLINLVKAKAIETANQANSQAKKERLAREFITQNSQLESIESQIKLVKENYAEPQMDSLANELTLLNNKLVNQEDTTRPMKAELQENQDKLATLMADNTRTTSEKNTARHEYSTLNQENIH